jgi:uncharacterized membrane protein
MGQVQSESSDRRMEKGVGYVLRAGVVTAAAIVLAGGLFYLIRYGNTLPDYSTFKGEPAELRHPATIIRDTLSFRRRATIELGLLVLMATPVLVVFYVAINFWRQRDYTYVCICLIVLTVLIYSLISGYWTQ